MQFQGNFYDGGWRSIVIVGCGWCEDGEIG